jgi:hypothetical protein
MLLVEPPCQLQEVVGILGIHDLIGCCRRDDSHRAGRGASALEFRDATLRSGKLVEGFLVFGNHTPHFHDYLVKKVIDFVLVVSFTELRGLETFVDDVLGSECHKPLPLQ